MTEERSRHGGKFYLEMLALAFGGCAVAGILLVWWLIQAPLRLDFLKPALENAITRKTGMHSDIGHLALVWQGMGSPLEIQLDDVTMHNRSGDTVATFQAAAVGVWTRYLFRGEVRPLSLTLIAPELTAARQADGSLSFGFGGNAGGGEPLPQLLGDIFKPAPNSSLAAWEQVGIRKGHLVVLDEHAQPLAQANEIDVTLTRTATGTTGTLGATLQTEAVKAPLSLKADYQAASGILSTHGELYDLPLDALAGLDPALAALAGAAVPLAAAIDTVFTPAFSLDTAHLTVAIGEGQLSLPDILPAPIPVASGAIDLGYAANPKRIDLYGFGINLKGPVFDASAVATLEDAAWHFDLTGAFKQIGVDQLAVLWPKSVAPGGFQWVTGNLSGGSIDDGTLHLTGQAPGIAPDQIAIDEVKAAFNVTDTTVHYFGELPDVKNVNGSVAIDQQGLMVTLTGGHTDTVNLTGGTVLIDGFADTLQTIKIDTSLAGPVGAALAIINHAPLYYAKKIKLDPQAVQGSATTQLHLDFPLLKTLKTSEINLLATANLQNVTLPAMIGRHAIDTLNGTLTLDTAKLDVAGTCIVENMPVTMKVRQNFNHQDGIDTIVGFTGLATDAGRMAFGLDAPERLLGNVGVTGTYRDFGTTGNVALELDLTQAVLKMGELAYVKPEGHAASASLSIDLRKGAVNHIGDIKVKARGLDIRGAADLYPETGQIQRLSLDRLQVDNTDVALDVQTSPNGDSVMGIRGRVIDVEPLINEKHAEGETSATEAKTATRVDVDIAALRTSANSHVDNVTGTLQLQGRSWQSANFTAMAAGQPLQFSYAPDAAGDATTLKVTTEDAGSFLAGFGLTNSVRGGKLVIAGQQPPKIPGEVRQPLQGHLDLNDFRLVDMPVMARMLSLLSLTGFVDSFSGTGIAFDSLTGDFTVGNTELTVSNGKLAGSALGLTIFGTSDRDAGTLDLHGTAVPFYSVNEFLNEIPLLGKVLTGGKGQGMFAATYKVQGTFDKPEVSVNPLSVLTPGIVRDLFFFRSDRNPVETGN